MKNNPSVKISINHAEQMIEAPLYHIFTDNLVVSTSSLDPLLIKKHENAS